MPARQKQKRRISCQRRKGREEGVDRQQVRELPVVRAERRTCVNRVKANNEAKGTGNVRRKRG